MRPKFYLRTLIIDFIECKNIKVVDITIKNAACWVQSYDRCVNLNIEGIRVESDAYWNNDGIDIVDCKNVRITDCFINASDDGICLKSHLKENSCDSIYIANCKVRSSASAIKFGTKVLGGIKNVIINIIIVIYKFPVIIKSWIIGVYNINEVIPISVHKLWHVKRNIVLRSYKSSKKDIIDINTVLKIIKLHSQLAIT